MTEALAERQRLGVAVIELMAESGYEGLSAEAIAARAGIERTAFKRHFPDVHACVLQVYWEYTEAFTELVYAAFATEVRWRDGFRAAAYAAARYIRDNPQVVRFGTVQMFGAGLMAQAQRESHLQRMVDLIDAGRQELADPDSIGRNVAEGVLGSIYGQIVQEVQSGRGTRSAEDFVPDLMYLAVRPYLGHDIAREELSIPPPPEAEAGLGDGASIQPRTLMRQGVHVTLASRYGPPVSKVGPAGDDAALRLAKLPPGRHGLPREFVTQNQRDRLAAGTIAVVAERGFNAATITQICAAAGVSRRTFYAYFSSKEECFFAAYDTIAEHLRVATDAATAAAGRVAGPGRRQARRDPRVPRRQSRSRPLLPDRPAAGRGGGRRALPDGDGQGGRLPMRGDAATARDQGPFRGDRGLVDRRHGRARRTQGQRR